MYCLGFDKIELKETKAERDRMQQVEVFVTHHY